jgi:hypothetical protein
MVMNPMEKRRRCSKTQHNFVVQETFTCIENQYLAGEDVEREFWKALAWEAKIQIGQ